MGRERSGARAHISPWMALRHRRSWRVLPALAIVAVAAALALTSMAGSSAQEGAVGVEVRVWQHVDRDQTVYLSARPARGSWNTLGTIPLALEEGPVAGPDHRYADITLDVPLQGGTVATVVVRVWQHVEWTRIFYVTAWPARGSWYIAEPIPLALDDGPDPTGKYRYGDIALGLPLPSTPRPESCEDGIAVPDPERNPGLVQDCEALLAARDILVGDGPALNWSPERPVAGWTGVTVNGKPGRVTELSLSRALSGSSLGGSIPPELGKLSKLTGLSLEYNELTGEIPPELGQLAELTTLALNRNNLTGGIPPELGNLLKLNRLWLGDNDLTGEVPLELGQLPDLDFLRLGGSRLTCMPRALHVRFDERDIGVNLPACDATSTAPPSAASAEACSNAVAVPDPGANPGLVDDCATLLDVTLILLGQNPRVTWSPDQPIEEWEGVTVDGSPARVTELRLPHPWKETELPARLARLTELRVLSAPGVGGRIPPQLGQLANLEHLRLVGQMRGAIPPELGQLSNLRILNLEDNFLRGGIPPELGQLVNLTELNLSSNHLLTEPIPPELGQLSNLVTLNLEDSELSGAIPPELGALSSLEELRLGGNELTGEIPTELARLGKLRILSLSSWLSGGVYGGNELTGQIPPELGQLANLERLDLSNSLLTGPIPKELGALSKLLLLDLYDSHISGPIPPELGSLSSLSGLDLARTQISGEIPPELGSLASLTGLDLSGNQLTGEIPPELGMLSRLSTLNLSDNVLAGPIPPELGTLPKLKRVYLSGNQLTGGMPPEFGQLPELRVLDLRDNQLTGSIPAELGELNFDMYDAGLYLSGNEWSGCLPLALRPLLEISDHTWTSDLRGLGLSYCQCLAPVEETPAPDLAVGVDGIPHLRDGDETGVAGTYRLTFSLVIDLPAGGVFRLGQRHPGRDNDGDMHVKLYETTSASALVIDPFTGYEYSRSVIDGPEDCEGNPSHLFDQVVGSARNQPPYTPATPDSIESLEDVEYFEGGGTYWLNPDIHLIFDVPEGARFSRGWSGLCADPGRCYTFLTLTDEETNSTLRLDEETGEPGWRVEVSEEGQEQGVGAVFEQIIASVRQYPAPPSCERPETAPDCAILLEARDTLAGDAELNWSDDVPIHQWWGVTVDRWTGRVTEVHPARRGLTGEIPPGLGELSALKLLWLGPYNQLTGEIPPELGQLWELETLYLGGNQLAGEIPGELAELSKLRRVDLEGNRLEGCLPEAWRYFGIDMGTEESNRDLRRCGKE